MLQVSIYPNPASNLFTIKSLNSQILIETVNIFNLQGKLIQSISKNKVTKVQIDTKELAKGLYLAEITTNTGNKNIHKLIIK